MVGTVVALSARSSAQGAAVPSPWSVRDIGSPAIAGTSSFDPATGSFAIDAGGSDIWGTADQFHFVYQPVTGDAVITARIDAVTSAHEWSKAGVMIRSSLNANGAHGFALVSAGRGAGFQRRPAVGGSSLSTVTGGIVAPEWVRLARSGSTVTASISSNGTSWTTVGSETIALGATVYVGLAVTSHNPSQVTSADIAAVTVTGPGTTALPPPMQAQDVGGPAVAGSSQYNAGTYTVTGGGRDINDASDEFQFAYQTLTGDADVSVKVSSLGNTNASAKAGVMIRQDRGAGAINAFVAVTPQMGYLFQRRATLAGVTVNTAGGAGAAPGWVRLKRTGDLLTAYRSSDGTNWTVIGSDSFPMTPDVYVGIAVTSHNTSTATTAVLTNLNITQSQPNQPPAATLTAPATGASYTAPATMSLTASASDADGNLSRVDFYNGTTLLASDTTAPYAMTWSNVAAGTYALKATAVDAAGATGSSAVATVTVGTVNQPPTATLTSPTSGATFSAPAGITLAATASDPNGTVARVDFYNGTTLLGSDTTSPYSFTWSNVAAGTYSVRATAVDNAGASGSSATASITVSSASTGLLAAYGLNEGSGSAVGDSSGGGRNGTITGATWVAGRYGQGLSFDGNDVVTFGDVDLPGSFTVMGWLQTRSLYTGTCGSFVVKERDYGFEICSGVLMASVGDGLNFTATAKQTWTTADLNVWKHVAMTFDGTTIRLYVEGVLANSVAGAHATNNNPLVFGRWTAGTNPEYWNGLVDEVRIYSRALTAAEVQTDRNAPITGGPSNQPPTASLTAPANGATFTAPASVSLTATGSDSDGTVARVEFYNGSTLLGSDTTAPYAFTWSNVAAGTYALKATAVDNAGATGSSAVATITVTGNPAPVATLTAPANGATFTAPASVSLTATASDSNGTVARVEFYNGSTLVGSDTTAPYAFTWSNVAAGTYALKATAVDNAGATGSSAVATITVTGNQVPVATLTAPANGATFSAPASVALTATASDSNGTVARVEFYNGAVLLATDTTAPYSYTWSNVAAGTYAVRAIAYDNLGASGTSATATITVNAVLPPPTSVVFQKSTDHATTVTSYLLEIFANGANPDTATPVASSDLGKPAPATNGDITVNRATLFSGLAPGTYLLTVSSVGSGGKMRSTSLTFTR